MVIFVAFLLFGNFPTEKSDAIYEKKNEFPKIIIITFIVAVYVDRRHMITVFHV